MGHRRRQGWLSNLHLGARDTEKGGYAMFGKTFKGLTDEMLAWQTTELLKLDIGRDGIHLLVEPKLVVEIAYNEIQISPRYASGLALRFARVKSYRRTERRRRGHLSETCSSSRRRLILDQLRGVLLDLEDGVGDLIHIRF